MKNMGPQLRKSAVSLSSPYSTAAAGGVNSSVSSSSSSPNSSLVVSQASPQMPLHNCQFGGDYVITEALEASSLYSCINKSNLQEYACKVVPTKRYQEYLAGYLRLDGNPGINSIENIFVGPHQTYIVFSPSHGDLHSYVRARKRLKESEVCSLYKQIASIVFDCHANGIVLRDLKLRKFVFRDAEQTCLKLETLDDAVVLADPEDDLLGDKHGCPAYVSPEILATVNGRYSGRAADCWSLGVILYTMLVGRYPFHDADPSLLFGKIRRGLFQVPNTLSPLAKCLIKSLLRKDPDERLTAEDLLASNWFTLMSSPNTYYHKHHSALCASSSSPSVLNTITASGPTSYTAAASTPSSPLPSSDFMASSSANNQTLPSSFSTSFPQSPSLIMQSIFGSPAMMAVPSTNSVVMYDDKTPDLLDQVVPDL